VGLRPRGNGGQLAHDGHSSLEVKKKNGKGRLQRRKKSTKEMGNGPLKSAASTMCKGGKQPAQIPPIKKKTPSCGSGRRAPE